MRKGIATVSISGTLEEKLSAIAAAGFDGVEIFDNDLIASPLRAADVRRRCADLGLTIELFQPIRDVEGVDPERFPAVLRRLRRKFEIMNALGTGTALVCSNATPDAIADPDLSAEQLHAAAELAAEHGCTLAFEALAWGTHIDRVSLAWDVVERADHCDVGLCVDTFHMLARGENVSVLNGIPGHRIMFLQVADAPHLSMDVLEWSRHFRCFPGQGTLALDAVVAAVVEAGYRGPISLEVFSDVVRTADPGLTSLDAMRSLLQLEERLKARWQAEHRAVAVELFSPPPPPTSVRPAFVELAVGGDDLDATLGGMGFAMVGRHRSKHVAWWRNGEANVLLNTEPATSHSAPVPRVTALGVLTDDLRSLQERSTAMLWPRVQRRLGPGEAPLLGIAAPSGAQVLVSEAEASATDWQQDFDPVPEVSGHSGAGFAIDHLGCAVPADLLDAEIAFYRTIFGMISGPSAEFMEPQGRLRSRVLRPDAGDLRLVLNVNEGPSDLPGAGGFNQLAFRCEDIYAVASRLRTRGLDLMAIPDNYYDDLHARFDLSDAAVERMRSHQLMYDEGPAGHLLHLYTGLIGNAFFIEVLQRVGEYEGYGAANTPVRLAAQLGRRGRPRRPAA
ncbi:sugar phosphate isomerase/epimerase and 4-hydroxyphenylpyruvate domain-containing protein [Jatrophihabitans telluris]|uniref:3-dehydroshikimate dehydratase n=1 Tax=Jatrophihabitans telluris TaxID=2038343 RepID=A0ABY4R1Y4_9ACTN|nr:sugar phosphate isomerase/epimerase and 4-hydroxyphenylpyruvate domain-containing protein [Jatrophihabitans telluris]UQX89740.1 sugar phosphate isomerase/epimerase and 4-hydroxyphenylpyruvate domain-containing protein [Jatrophihabitans telluris]